MVKDNKFRIYVFDRLLLKNGQIIFFNTYDYGIVIQNDKTCIVLSDVIKDYVYGMGTPVHEDMFKPIEVVAKVKLKCELQLKCTQ